LEQAVQEWMVATRLALDADVVLRHATRGPHPVADVMRSNAHDAYHHGWDLERIVRWNEA
jgi:hypothetical protein